MAARRKEKYTPPLNSPNASEEKRVTLRRIKPTTESQRFYYQCLQEARIVIGKGPAGTGKTYLACFSAIEKLLAGEIEKIYVTRPIVEAGEELGALPGEMEDKVSPYMIPIMDSFADFIGAKKTEQLIEDRRIEIAPLAYMRGRTLKHCVAILDESQNCTQEQIKMFLTRMGEHSQLVLNGDTRQSDILGHRENALEWVSRKLSGIDPDIVVVEFKMSDIVRDPLIGKILNHLESPD